MRIRRNGDVYAVEADDGVLVVAPHPTQEALIEFYLRIKQEGTLERFYHERVPTPLEFLSQCISQKNLLLGCYRMTDCMDTYSLVGLGTAGQKFELGSGHGKRELGEVFVRKEKQTLLFGQLMLQWVFDRCGDTEVLYGCTPVPNRAAVAYLKRIGFSFARDQLEIYCSWKGKPCSAVISWMTREKWTQITPFR